MTSCIDQWTVAEENFYVHNLTHLWLIVLQYIHYSILKLTWKSANYAFDIRAYIKGRSLLDPWIFIGSLWCPWAWSNDPTCRVAKILKRLHTLQRCCSPRSPFDEEGRIKSSKINKCGWKLQSVILFKTSLCNAFLQPRAYYLSVDTYLVTPGILLLS